MVSGFNRLDLQCTAQRFCSGVLALTRLQVHNQLETEKESALINLSQGLWVIGSSQQDKLQCGPPHSGAGENESVSPGRCSSDQ